MPLFWWLKPGQEKYRCTCRIQDDVPLVNRRQCRNKAIANGMCKQHSKIHCEPDLYERLIKKEKEHPYGP